MTSYSIYHKSFADELLKKHNLPTGNEEEDKNLKNKKNLLNQRNITNSNINNNNSKNYGKNKKHNNPFMLNSNNYNFSEL
jgi:hypothetical protein